ncbi:hypothetical protein Save01_08535 [Streptomyces avermitilis]
MRGAAGLGLGAVDELAVAGGEHGGDCGGGAVAGGGEPSQHVQAVGHLVVVGQAQDAGEQGAATVVVTVQDVGDEGFAESVRAQGIESLGPWIQVGEPAGRALPEVGGRVGEVGQQGEEGVGPAGVGGAGQGGQGDGGAAEFGGQVGWGGGVPVALLVVQDPVHRGAVVVYLMVGQGVVEGLEQDFQRESVPVLVQLDGARADVGGGGGVPGVGERADRGVVQGAALFEGQGAGGVVVLGVGQDGAQSGVGAGGDLFEDAGRASGRGARQQQQADGGDGVGVVGQAFQGVAQGVDGDGFGVVDHDQPGQRGGGDVVDGLVAGPQAGGPAVVGHPAAQFDGEAGLAGSAPGGDLGDLEGGGTLAPLLGAVEVGVAEQVGHHGDIGEQQFGGLGPGLAGEGRPGLVQQVIAALDGQDPVPAGAVGQDRLGVETGDLLSVRGQGVGDARSAGQQGAYG